MSEQRLDPIDFGLDARLNAPALHDENLFFTAVSLWRSSCREMQTLLVAITDIRDSISHLVRQRWGLDATLCGLRFHGGSLIDLNEACAFVVQHPDLDPTLDATCSVFGIAPGHALHGLTPLQLLERLKTLDLDTALTERWVSYWNSRAPGLPVARRVHAARQHRLHLQAACELAFAEDRLDSRQRQALQVVIDGDQIAPPFGEARVYVETLYLKMPDGARYKLPGALVITCDSAEGIGQLLYLPAHSPVLLVFAERDEMERYLLQRQRNLWATASNTLRPRNSIEYEVHEQPLEAASRQLLSGLRQRMLAALLDNPHANLAAPGAAPLAAAERFDAWRKAGSLFAEYASPSLTIDPDAEPPPLPGFGRLYRDMPLSTRLAKVSQQLAAFEALQGEQDGLLSPPLQMLWTSLDALSQLREHAFEAATAVIEGDASGRARLKQAHIAGLRTEADIQVAMKLLAPTDKALLDAVLDSPVAGQRLQPVIALSLALQHGSQPAQALDGLLLLGHGTSTLDSQQPLLLYWPGEAGGLQRFASFAALERELFKLPAQPGELKLLALPITGDAIDHGLNRQLEHFERQRQTLTDEATLAQLRAASLAGLLLPSHTARDYAQAHLQELQHTLILARDQPDWLRNLQPAQRQPLRQLLEDYLRAVRRSRTLLEGKLPPRNAFAEQQVAAYLREDFKLASDVQVSLDLPDSVSHQRDLIAGSGSPGTPGKLIRVPSAARSTITLAEAALHNLDDDLEQRVSFMQVLVNGGNAADRNAVMQGLSVARLRRLMSALDLAGRYERHIREAFLGAAGESAFSRDYRQECLLQPLHLMLKIQGAVACQRHQIDTRGLSVLHAAIAASDPTVQLLPVMLATGGPDTAGRSTTVSAASFVHAEGDGVTLLHLPDSPDGHFLRQYPDLESARLALFRLTFDSSMAGYLSDHALHGDAAAHRSRLVEAAVRHYDGIIAAGPAWPEGMALTAHLCNAQMGRLITAHRASARSNGDLYLEQKALQHGMVFNYIKMALGALPFVGAAVGLFDAWTSANHSAAAFARGDTFDGMEQLESVLLSLLDVLMDLLPGGSISPAAARQVTRQRQLARLSRLPLDNRAGTRTALQRFSGFEYAGDLTLAGLAAGDEGIYRNVFRHAQGDFIVNHRRVYQVAFDRDRHTWRLAGPRSAYRPAIALDDTGNWDTHGALFGVNIVSPVSGGGGVLGHVADAIDPMWPAAMRQHLPRWWTDPALRRKRALRRSADAKIRALADLNKETVEQQQRFNRSTDSLERRKLRHDLVVHYTAERKVADEVYPELEELYLLSSGNNRSRARDLQSRVAWLQVNRMGNELNSVKNDAVELLNHIQTLIGETTNTPPTDVAQHLQIMQRRKRARIQLIEHLDRASELTQSMEHWNRRITVAKQRAKNRELMDDSQHYLDQPTCDMLKVANHAEIISLYDAAQDETWFILQRQVAKGRVKLDRSMNNQQHLPALRANAQQRKRMLEACIQSYEKYRRNLLAWNTSYPEYFDQQYVAPLLHLLQRLTDLAESWIQKIPPATSGQRPDKHGPAPRKLFETEDNQLLAGVEEGRRFTISGINDRTEVYVPGNEGRWRLQTDSDSPRVTPVVSVERLVNEARNRLKRLPAYRAKVQGYVRQHMLPADLEYLLHSEADELRLRAERIVEQAADNPLVGTLREQAQALMSEGSALRVSQSLLSRKPNGVLLDYLMEQRALRLVKVNGLVELPRRGDGRPDFLQEYEILDITGAEPRPLWYAHFHYESAQPKFDGFVKEHLKTAEQRRLGLQWQTAQGDSAERIWRGAIGRPLAHKHFSALFDA